MTFFRIKIIITLSPIPPVKEECDCSQDCTGTPCEAECLPLAEPVCSWTGYCDWSDCTKECGGRRIRSRDCQCPEGYEGEPDCIGEMFEFDDESCPVCEEGEDVIEAALAPVAEADEYDSYATYYPEATELGLSKNARS